VKKRAILLVGLLSVGLTGVTTATAEPARGLNWQPCAEDAAV
jgi:hypothetical protein